MYACVLNFNLRIHRVEQLNLPIFVSIASNLSILESLVIDQNEA